MNIDEYENRYLTIYAAFAETVRFIVAKALENSRELLRPQSVQCRAKGIESLRRRLAESGKLESQALELERRDLAGVRLIFYTNNDVDRFISSSLIRENFEIEDDSIRVHHPVPENKGGRYRAIHYTVRLREDRIRLPEYTRFAGLRCEIQVQTILNHAWSETSHDVLYKDNLGDGYGGKAMKGIALRFERIMDLYLIPAGFEIQKAQQEYERVLQGKELFDKDITNLLDNAKNSNERYEILSGLKDYAIPNYDDLPSAYHELMAPLLRAVKAARETPVVPIETTYGNINGFDATAVTKLVIEIVELLRFADSVGTLQLLIDIFWDEPNEDIRQTITSSVKQLSEYNIDAYNHFGLMLQENLVKYLAEMRDIDVDRVRPIALVVWTEAIQSDVTGAKWTASSITIRSGALPVSDQLLAIRDISINALFAAYDRSTNDSQRFEIIAALDAATRTPHQAQYSNELLATTLRDTTRIVDFFLKRTGTTSFELLQHLEYRFLNDYIRARDLTEDAENRFACQIESKELVTAIFRFRDEINADDWFLRFKVLVGFESVFPGHWQDDEYDFNGASEYRNEEVIRFIEEINSENEGTWFGLVARCAAAKSADQGSFPVLGEFILKLAERKPEVADRLLALGADDIRAFLPGFLNGLVLSGRNDLYERVLMTELGSARSLTGIAHHIRNPSVSNSAFASSLLECAIEKNDQHAVIQCLLFALEYYGTEKLQDSDVFLGDSLSFLNARKDARWVSDAWFLQKVKRLFVELTPERLVQLLKNLGYLHKVNHHVERILVRLAVRDAEAIWDFFGDRLAREAERDEVDGKFEAIPFRFHGLEKELSKNPQLAISKGLTWFTRDSKLFRFRGGRLLSSAFPNCTQEFSAALTELIKSGGNTEVDFALAILQNFQGEPSTFVILKEIVSRYSGDNARMNEVRIAIENTGVVTGEFGFADAWRTKKTAMTEWLGDEREEVKMFAGKHIAELDQKIAAEHRRAESNIEMRNRNFDNGDGDNGRDDDDARLA